MTTQPITPLRQRMLDDMKLRNIALSTRKIYVSSVAGFSAFHGRSPDELTLEDVRDYQLHLVARGLKASSICQVTSALRFLYAVTLGRSERAVRRWLPGPAPLPPGVQKSLPRIALPGPTFPRPRTSSRGGYDKQLIPVPAPAD